LNKVGRYWHFNLRVNGKRAHGSTRATDIATARAILETKRQELLRGQMKRPRAIPTLRVLFREWWKAHERVFSPKHLTTVECIFRRWVLPVLGGHRLDEIRNQEATKMRASVLAEGHSGRYANNVLVTLKAILNFAVRLEYLVALPFSVRPIRLQVKPRPTVPTTHVRGFLLAADRIAENSQVSEMLWTLLGLGLREGELLGMRWEWFDPIQRTYVVGKAKGKEARVLPVPDWLWSKLWVFPQMSLEWVFPAADGVPHRSGYLRKPLTRLCKALGLPNISQHRLRASFATLHAEAGTPITEIQGMLGHKNIQTTMIYVETGLDAKRKAQDVLSQRLELMVKPGVPTPAV
jgi:integrase